jgi:hypothetical protein
MVSFTTNWKDIGDNQDGGTANYYGGLDIRKYMRMLNGVSNVDNVDMNSPWYWRDQKMNFLNPAGTFKIGVSTPAITSDVVHSWPLYNSNDTITTNNSPGELRNKTINAAFNTITGIGGASSSNRKSGRIQAVRTGLGGTVSEGLLQNHIDMGTVVSTSDPPPYGLYWNYSTGTTSNTNAGLRYSVGWVRRQYNPRIKVKARTPVTASNAWFLFGLSVDTDITGAETAPIDDTESAFLLGWRNTPDTGITVFRNGGTNAVTTSPIVVATGQSKPIEVTTWEIDMRAAGDVLVTVTNAATGATIYTATFTTNLPVTTVDMRPVFQIKNTDSVNHDLWLHYMELEQDM